MRIPQVHRSTVAGLLLMVSAFVPVLLPKSTAQTAAQTVRPVPDGVGIEEQLGEYISLNATFKNAAGEEVVVEDLLDGETPVVLNFVYHNCPMLCSILLESFAQTLQEMDFAPGSEFEIITVSFSATETPDLASRQKKKYLAYLDSEGAGDGWHFLTGAEDQIQSLAASAGFSFRWVESRQEFAHPAALIFLSPEGKITRYIHGMVYKPDDVRRAVIEASEGRVGSAVDRVLLYCYRYDPDANSYVLHATSLMKIGGLLTLLVVGSGLFLFWRRERSAQHTAPDGWPSPKSA